ncbi:hypothetical protein [Rufibacter sp. DG15C]|uniref:hypothetical protein n=1 Tax=Rufibacter sp. DG15C TaxID=1379909 RepID=UPI000A557D74|nr:hypothetical protein [Rufibacter sp. DG15C]
MKGVVPKVGAVTSAAAPPNNVTVRSSMAYIPSLPPSLVSFHLRYITASGAKLTLIVPEKLDLFAAKLPSTAAAAVVDVNFSTKSKAVTVVQVPVVKLVASVLYSNTILSVISFAEALLHCSITASTLRPVFVAPDVFLKETPKAGTVVPDANIPNARSLLPVEPTLYTAPELLFPSFTEGVRAWLAVPDPANLTASQPVGSAVVIPSKF